MKIITKIGGLYTGPFCTAPTKIIRKLFQPAKDSYSQTVPASIPTPSYARNGVINTPNEPEIKSTDQIKKMRPACQLAASILRTVGDSIQDYLERLRDAIVKQLRDEQAGFQPNRSCTDQIATLCIILEQSIIVNLPLYSGFVDYEKAFDSSNGEFLWKLVGMTTEDINAIVHAKCIDASAYPSPLKYRGFPKSVCTSVNNVACHGIPGPLELQDGDIINVDITVFYKGYHGDTSQTFMVGNVNERTRTLVETARQCRDVGISVCKHGALFSDIGDVIYTTAVEAGFDVIPSCCGHGIGEYFHGPPDIVHVPSDVVGDASMMSGMTFTIEPILCDGSPEIKVLDDGWTVVTVDGSKSAQFEHTILVTDDGYEILTQ